jgi:hypothetical protein
MPPLNPLNISKQSCILKLKNYPFNEAKRLKVTFIQGVGEGADVRGDGGREPNNKNYVAKDKPHHEDVWGSGGIATPSFASVLDGERSASRPGGFIAGERAPGTHWI